MPDPGLPAESTVAAPTTSTTDQQTSATAVPSTAPTEVDTGDVTGFDIIEARLGGRMLTLALADDSVSRSRGLMEVADLGDLDGMLFSWGGDTVSSRFTMRNTLIPLHIVFFDADGRIVSRTDMVPCDVDDCPTYGAAGPYAFAIEFPAGTAVSTDDRLELDPTG